MVYFEKGNGIRFRISSVIKERSNQWAVSEARQRSVSTGPFITITLAVEDKCPLNITTRGRTMSVFKIFDLCVCYSLVDVTGITSKFKLNYRLFIHTDRQTFYTLTVFFPEKELKFLVNTKNGQIIVLNVDIKCIIYIIMMHVCVKLSGLLAINLRRNPRLS